MLLLSVLAILLAGCDDLFSGSPAARVGSAVKATSGHVKDEPLRFHPSEPRLLAVRQVPIDDMGIRETGQRFDRKIIDIDCRDPERPRVREIEALEGGSSPSYLGDAGILALDSAGRLVLVPDIDEDAELFTLKKVQSRPAKPVGAPDGRHVAYLALPNLARDQSPMEHASALRYHAFVVSVNDGEPVQVSHDLGDKALVVGVDFADEKSVLVTYHIVDGRGPGMLRIERVGLEGKNTELALFANYPPMMALDKRFRFFITIFDTANSLAIVSRDLSEKRTIDMKAELLPAVALAPDGRMAALSRFDIEDDGYHVYLAPIPESFSDLPSEKRGDD